MVDLLKKLEILTRKITMARSNNVSLEKTVKKTRKGVHAKSKTSRVKGSKFYKKKYRGQGR